MIRATCRPGHILPPLMKSKSGSVPFLDIALLEADDFGKLVDDVFAKDRYFVAKGMVEVIKWRI